MKALHILGMALFSLLAVGGLMSANGVTGNLVAGCDCISDACMKACPDGGEQCCLAASGELKPVEQGSPWPGYTASFVGLAGFFTILAANKKEEDMY
jgi:hypothetical protein